MKNNDLLNSFKLFIFISIILICLFYLIPLRVSLVNAQTNSTKFLSNVSIEDNFDHECVIVILQPSFSEYNRINQTVLSKI